MKKNKQKLKDNNPPFRLPSQIRHRQQLHFLYLINEVTPELGEAIRKLNTQCMELFGEYPRTNDDLENSRKSPDKIWEIFRECIWKESRENYGNYHYYPFLRGNNEALNQILIQEENLRAQSDRYIESLTEEELDLLREKFASEINKPKESLIIQDLQSSYWLWFRKNDENYDKLLHLKHSKLNPLLQFQKDFDALLTKFYLEKEWLAASVFEAAWNGSGILAMDSRYMEIIPKEIISEIKNRLGKTAVVKIGDRFIDEYDDFLQRDIPLPDPFLYQEQYYIYSSFEEFEQKALESYREYLRNYFRVIKESFEKFGYKGTQGKTNNYKRVLWLVLWNMRDFKYLWEIAQHIPEFEETNIENEHERKKIIDKLMKAFEEFEKFDLPVRPWVRSKKEHAKKG